MARGGKREGAGRKEGSANKRTRELADQAAAEGLTPLEIMLSTMRFYWKEGIDAKSGRIIDPESIAKAIGAAKEAAPFIHPRLSSTKSEVKGSLTLEQLIATLGDESHAD